MKQSHNEQRNKDDCDGHHKSLHGLAKTSCHTQKCEEDEDCYQCYVCVPSGGRQGGHKHNETLSLVIVKLYYKLTRGLMQEKFVLK